MMPIKALRLRNAVAAASLYGTWNPADKVSLTVLSNGNLTATNPNTAAQRGVRTTNSKSSGKWYVEIVINVYGATIGAGIAKSTASLSNYLGNDGNAWIMWGNYPAVRKYNNNTGVALTGPTAFANGVVIGIALDLDNGKVWFASNNNYSGVPGVSGEAYSGLTGPMFIACDPFQTGGSFTLRSDPSQHSYSPPAGFTPGWQV